MSAAKSPVGPTPPLPGSVEQSYRQKCIDLKKRINEIESSNDVLVVRIQRARRGIQRMRLERAFLLQQLEQRTDPRVEDSEGSPSPPPTVWRASLYITSPQNRSHANTSLKYSPRRSLSAPNAPGKILLPWTLLCARFRHPRAPQETAEKATPLSLLISPLSIRVRPTHLCPLP